MSQDAIEIRRPDRWDHPLDPAATDEQVQWLLTHAPFSSMDAERFARNAPLPDVLKNDCRLLPLKSGDIIFREGQYGGTAYLVLDGRVRALLTPFLTQDEASKLNARGSFSFNSIFSFARRKKPHTNRRKRDRGNSRSEAANEPVVGSVGYRSEGNETRLFLQDVSAVYDSANHAVVEAGEMFGEMAAVTRTPRDFTAVAETDCLVLEIRWQGLKLLKQDPAFRRLLDERYRSELLGKHLTETSLFKYIPAENLDAIVAAAKFEQFGDLEWYAKYRKTSTKSPSQKIASEPLIADEGSYATGLWIVRSGFARLSRRQGAGHRTLAYLGKGKMFGLSELANNHSQQTRKPPLPYQHALRAVGYVDLLCIPKQTVTQHVLPFIRAADLPPPIEQPRYQFGQPVLDAPLEKTKDNIETGLLEFLVERRLINGHQTMVIDTDRCTRCDDCVKACASTHGGTPVFSREGPQYGPWMFAHACMHCEDPVCMIGCPTGAIHRDSDSGLVKISEQSCIGCKTCAESCPYDNIRMVVSSDSRGRARLDEATGLPILQASKCDLCSSSGTAGPACQTACPHEALVRIDLSDVAKVSSHIQRKAG